jgi:hypothetical protein
LKYTGFVEKSRHPGKISFCKIPQHSGIRCVYLNASGEPASAVEDTGDPTMNFKTLALAVSLVLAPAAIFAQSATAPTSTPNTPTASKTINERKENQQDRIAQGVKSGQLTAGETSHLEKQEAGINKEEAGMRAQDNGHLTKQDRKTLNQQQNVESKRIYRDKHNGRKA